MLFSTSAITRLYESEAQLNFEAGQAHPLLVITSYPFYLIAIYLMIRNTSGAFVLLWKEKFFISLITLSLLSALWSQFPLVTLRESIEFTGLTLFGLYMVMRFTSEEQHKLMAITLGIIAIFSVITAVLLPKYGIMQWHPYGENHPGAWRGVFGHKNSLGLYSNFCLIVFLLLNVRELKHRIIKWGIIMLSFCLSILSKSGGATLIMLIVICLIPFYKTFHNHIYIRIISYCSAIIVISVVSTLLLLKLDSFLNLMGKDATLTGRDCLWKGTLGMLERRPLLGYGYGGFWLGGDSGGNVVRDLCKWAIPHSHNGFLEIGINLGLVGFFIFFFGYFRTARLAFRNLYLSASNKSIWPFVFVTLLFLDNITENNLVFGGGLLWIVFVSITISLYYTNNRQSVRRTL
ncbi:MAG: O-antigen ligase family protein [Nitrospirae bacterium]|nr:O-antigen ligase family protein [Nitrospirota bacterium]